MGGGPTPTIRRAFTAEGRQTKTSCELHAEDNHADEEFYYGEPSPEIKWCREGDTKITRDKHGKLASFLSVLNVFHSAADR